MPRANFLPDLTRGGVPRYFFDATAGNDSNDGRTSGTPWKTVAKYNATVFPEGAKIYFKANESFPGRLIPAGAGGLSYIEHDRYGAGADPIIDGSAVAGALYVASGRNYLKFSSIDFAGGLTDATCTVLSHDVEFDGCTIRDSAAASGIACQGSAPHHLVIRNSTIQDNHNNGVLIGAEHPDDTHDNYVEYNTIKDNGTSVDAHHGVYVQYGTVVRGNNISGNSSAGIKINHNSVVSTSYYPVVYNNTCTGNRFGIMLTHDHVTCYNNDLYANEINLQILNDATDNDIQYNSLVNADSLTDRAIYILDSSTITGTVIQNNVIIQDAAVITKSIIDIAGGTMADLAALMNYNKYYYNGSTTAHIIYSTGDGGVLFDWTEFVAAGAEANGTHLSAVPDMETRYTDRRPIIGNLTGGGLVVAGYPTDINGATRPAHPTPGCYVSTTTLRIAAASVELATPTIAQVTFSGAVYADDYADGWVAGGTGASAIVSAARQADHKVVYFTLTDPLDEGDTLTLAYTAASGSYQDEYQEITAANIAATNVTNNVIHTLVDIDLETGDLTQFTGTQDPDGDLSADATAALNGTSVGLKCVVDDTTSFYGIKTFTASTTNIWRARLFFDPNTMTMGAGNTFSHLIMYNGGNAFAAIEVNYNGGYDFRGLIVSDTAAETETARQYVTDAPHRVELKVTRASSAIAGDGRIDLYVDAEAAVSVTGIDNYDRAAQFDKIWWGATGVDAGTSGTFFCDELKINNTGNEIGA